MPISIVVVLTIALTLLSLSVVWKFFLYKQQELTLIKISETFDELIGVLHANTDVLRQLHEQQEQLININNQVDEEDEEQQMKKSPNKKILR